MRKVLLMIFTFLPLLSFSQEKKSEGKNYALFIIIKDYESWTSLPEADVLPRKIIYELENNYGFEKIDFKLNLKKGEITSLLTNYQQRVFNKNDQLLIYICSHGYFDKTLGAVIPQNGQLIDPSYESWIAHPVLEALLSKIPCPHILFSLDACYSGTFGPKFQGMPNGQPFIPGDDCVSKINYLMQYKSRRFVTSGDTVRVPTDSHFAKKWLEALQTRNQDGIMSFFDLSSVLNEAYPKPYPGEFKGDESGDFLLIRNGACASDTAHVDPDKSDWEYAQRLNTIESYETYLESYPKGKFVRPAEQALEHLREDIFWQKTIKSATTEACSIYLAKYPKGRYRTEAENCVENKIDKIEEQLVFIPGGTFQMGCDKTKDPDCLDNEGPVFNVILSPYYLSKYEITVAQFRDFVEFTGYKTDIERRGDSGTIWSGTKWESKPGITWRCDEKGNLRPKSDFNHPVLYVSWQDANEYCKWISEKTGFRYRLPTEAEWEFAAGNEYFHNKYSWGNDPTSWKKVENLADESAKKQYPGGWSIIPGYDDNFVFSAPVGSFPPNALGLFDIGGNVREWCSDWYAPSFGTSQNRRDPKGPLIGSHRVVKGGSWYYDLNSARNTYRINSGPLTYDFQIGFRIARSKAQPEKVRNELRTERNPSIDMLQEALSDFSYNGLPINESTEARRMLQWIGVKSETIQSFQTSEGYYILWGKLPTSLEVRIWTSTYEPGCYGLRFQRDDLKEYIGVNETYLPICNQ